MQFGLKPGFLHSLYNGLLRQRGEREESYGLAWINPFTSYSDNGMSRGVFIYDKQSDGRRRANADGWASRPYPSGCGGHDGLAGKKGPLIRFCETNPPFFKDSFDVTSYTHVSCDGNVRRISVGSFWKPNPPERVFGGVLGRLEAFLPAKEERRTSPSPPRLRRDRENLETCDSAKRTGLEIDDFYVEQPKCK